jgi:hypothetical protein
MKASAESVYFREVAEAFGLEPATPGEETTVLVFTAHEPPPIPWARYVVYNMEQLTNHEIPAYFYERLRAAEAVWDYSLVNVEHLRGMGIQSVHVPYPPALHARPAVHTPRERTGAVFVGAQNERRREWLDGLDVAQRHGDAWGAARDELYARALVGVNVHYHGGPDASILEVHRIVPMITAGLLVVSERSSDAFYDELMSRAGVVFVNDKRDFKETVEFLVKRPALVRRLLCPSPAII